MLEIGKVFRSSVVPAIPCTTDITISKSDQISYYWGCQVPLSKHCIKNSPSLPEIYLCRLSDQAQGANNDRNCYVHILCHIFI